MNFSSFNQNDFDVIEREYAALKELAARRCRDKGELAAVQKAFDFANDAHKNVRRRSGEPYILHPIAVARIVVENIGLGYKSIIASLLHDVVEDTDYTVDDIRSLFGEKIAQLVDGLTKIKTVLDNEDRASLPYAQYESKSMQAENFKRILLTLGDDARVVLIKLADRLHNCRTIEFMPEHKRDKILSETMYIFIPLAHRLGLYSIKSEMENIWLRYKEPEDYRAISELIASKAAECQNAIDRFVEPIENALKREGYNFHIIKRIKTPYSVWHKMRAKNVPFDQVYDLYAVRIVFDPGSAEDSLLLERKGCYDIYAIVTSLYNSRNDRLRDWVKQPKSNGYEALHCTLMSPGGAWVEVQIRSKRMDDIAEKGIAAHWAYKQNGYASENDSEMDRWLEKVKEVIESPDLGALELLDIIHKDLIASEILVFTPKGQQIAIQSGATALDFAYLIHTHIGHHSIAAKVNMKLCPLSHILRPGDQVEIITAESGEPKAEWLSFLQTRHARRYVIDYLKTNLPAEAAKIDALTLESGGRKSGRIMTVGTERYEVCTCCNPIPGDPVVGFRTSEGIIHVHKKSCRVAEGLAAKFGDRMVVPDWESKDKADFPVSIVIKGIDRMGLLNEITRGISVVMGINMRKLVLTCDKGIFEGQIELLVHDRTSLERMIEHIQKLDGIQSVVRTDIQDETK